ncbi:MAG TPA: hypothetical protein VHI77_11155 [Solirubrobacterales bacterium]|jgi:hypothetical protein|nr:hypothetical protein [Solirubrobacterales bacterium]
MDGARGPQPELVKLVGFSTLVFSVLYFASDVLEASQGGFSEPQLWLTLIAEAAIPLFVIGLYLVQRRRMGRLGAVCAIAYAYSFVFFTGTVVYALLNGTSDFTALSEELGAAMVVHGAIMLFAGLGFGYAVARAGVLPRWSGIALMVGVVLVVVTQDMAEGPQLVAAGIRDLGFAAMGASLLGRDASWTLRTEG